VEEEREFERGWLVTSVHNRVGARDDSNASPLLGKRRNGKNVGSNLPPVGTIEELWSLSYNEFQEVDSASPKGKGKGKGKPATEGECEKCRMVPEMGGPMTESAFLTVCRHQMKRDIGCYVMSTLSTASRDQRRAGEFALLTLCLQSRNYAGAYRIVEKGTALCIRDCYYFLWDS
jgi:hypothetical protein